MNSARPAPARSINAATSCPDSAARISSASYSGSKCSAVADNGDGVRELLRVRHREIDRARAGACRPRQDATGQPNRRLRAAGDLDVPPGERARDADSERLADRLLAGEAPRVG